MYDFQDTPLRRPTSPKVIAWFLCGYKKVSSFCTLWCQGCLGGGALCHSSLAVGRPGDPARQQDTPGAEAGGKPGHLTPAPILHPSCVVEVVVVVVVVVILLLLTPAPHGAPILSLFTPGIRMGCVSRNRCRMNFGEYHILT